MKQLWFLYAYIWFDVLTCKFIVKNKFKMLAGFSPVVVADTKITFGYSFVASLKKDTEQTITCSKSITEALEKGMTYIQS